MKVAIKYQLTASGPRQADPRPAQTRVPQTAPVGFHAPIHAVGCAPRTDPQRNSRPAGRLPRTNPRPTRGAPPVGCVPRTNPRPTRGAPTRRVRSTHRSLSSTRRPHPQGAFHAPIPDQHAAPPPVGRVPRTDPYPARGAPTRRVRSTHRSLSSTRRPHPQGAFHAPIPDQHAAPPPVGCVPRTDPPHAGVNIAAGKPPKTQTHAGLPLVSHAGPR